MAAPAPATNYGSGFGRWDMDGITLPIRSPWNHSVPGRCLAGPHRPPYWEAGRAEAMRLQMGGFPVEYDGPWLDLGRDPGVCMRGEGDRCPGCTIPDPRKTGFLC